MTETIKLGNQIIQYTIKNIPRARRIRLIIHRDGRLVVTTPRRVSRRVIESLIKQKAEWIIPKLEYFKSQPAPVSTQGTSQDYKKYKEAARELAQKRLEYFNQVYGFKIGRLSIRNQATRWGSCSKKGNLNFNYKIAHLPAPLADYIIVHELCHLRELNHSPRFWRLVAQTQPDYLTARRELRRVGLALN